MGLAHVWCFPPKAKTGSFLTQRENLQYALCCGEKKKRRTAGENHHIDNKYNFKHDFKPSKYENIFFRAVFGGFEFFLVMRSHKNEFEWQALDDSGTGQFCRGRASNYQSGHI
jgi:hypothetical protein